MLITRPNKVKKLSAYCPKCGSRVVWKMTNTTPGAIASANCLKHFTQSRTEFLPDLDPFCMWKGAVRRTEFGDVEFLDSDGKTILKKR